MFRPRTLVLSAISLALPLFWVLGPKATTTPTTPLPGYQRQSITVAHRPQPLAVALWFAASGGKPKEVGGNALFDRVLVLEGAQPTGRDHPLVLISHGSGGNMDQMGWLASALVARGAIVAGVNHAGSTSGDSQPLASTRVWDRADDLRALLDAVLADPEFGPRIDAVVAIDAGYGHAMTQASLSAIDIPTLLITLGGPGTPWRETGMGPDGANLVAKIPGATAVELAPAWHFSFLPPCGRLGPLLVWLAGEEPICSDPAGTDRDSLHDLMSHKVADFLHLPEARGFDLAQTY